MRCQTVRQKELEALVRSVPAPPIPDGFADRLMARARLGGKVPRPVSRSPWKPLGWLKPQRFHTGLATTAALAAGLLVGVYLGQHTWQPSEQRSPRHTQMMQADPVAASSLGNLTGLGDDSLAAAYLGLTSAPNDPGT